MPGNWPITDREKNLFGRSLSDSFVHILHFSVALKNTCLSFWPTSASSFLPLLVLVVLLPLPWPLPNQSCKAKENGPTRRRRRRRRPRGGGGGCGRPIRFPLPLSNWDSSSQICFVSAAERFLLERPLNNMIRNCFFKMNKSLRPNRRKIMFQTILKFKPFLSPLFPTQYIVVVDGRGV